MDPASNLADLPTKDPPSKVSLPRFTHIYHKNQPNVGIPYVDVMGMEPKYFLVGG